jgi:type VI secretion system protein ImpL
MIAWEEHVPLANADSRIYVILFLFFAVLLKFLIADWDTLNFFQFRSGNIRKKLQPMQNQFQGAMQFLKKTFIAKHHKQVRLIQLPWYLLIGPQNAGKTSLLANSSVNFILQRQFPNQNPKNLETSENCNWWVTRDASIIDVPGKYFSAFELSKNTQTKSTPYPILWRFFLRLVKKYRGKDGIDGIVIAFPLPELMAQDDPKKYQGMARNLFQRLHELQKVFPKRLPYYLLITKCDLLPGFSEYFAELGNDETSQAWGVMLPEPERGESVLELLTQRFNTLIRKLNQQLIWRLHQERNPLSRPAIKDFPLQVERLKEFTYDFIKKLNTMHGNLSLQGVYLTSALQTPAETRDMLLENDEHSAQQEVQLYHEPKLSTRPYFIKQFITHGLANQHAEFTPPSKLYIWKRRATYASSASIIALTAVLLGHDFELGVENAYSIQNHLAEYRLTIEAFHNPNDHLLKTIALLDTLQKAVKQAGFKLDLAHLLTFYSDKSQEKVGLVYQEALQNILLPEIKNYFEEYLSLPINKNSDTVYAALKAYLMLGNQGYMQTDTLMLTLQQLLPKSFNPNDTQHLLGHLSTGLAAMNGPLALNENLVQKTRSFLTGTPVVQLGYIILKNTNNNNTEISINLGTHTSNSPTLLNPPIAELPLMYTAKNLSTILAQDINVSAEEAIKGNWVLGMNANPNPQMLTAVILQLRAMFINNYVDAWESLLNNMRLSSPTSIADADAMILNLINSDSPLLQLLQTLHTNTYFEPITSASPKLERLDLLFDKNNRADNVLFQIFSGLRFLHQYLQPIMSASDPRKAAFEALSYRIKHNDKPDALMQLRLIAEKSPEPIKNWLDDLSNHTWHLLMSEASSYINTAWEEQVMHAYRSDIANRYPFNTKSDEEVDLQKFTQFFGNPGLVLNFYNNVLQPFVDSSKPDWHWKMFSNEKLPFNEDALRQIQQALRIHHAFYPNGDNKIYVQFAIEPYQFGKSIKRVQLTINDKKIVDEDSGVHSPHVLTWPNTANSKLTSLQLTLQNKTLINRQYPGDWGWFKLVNQSFENSITRKQTLLNLSINAIPVKYYLFTDGQQNPFLSLNLKHFTLPEKIGDINGA